jgi:hypothetical protein
MIIFYLKIKAISDSKDTIVNYKYKNENNNIFAYAIYSSLLLSSGIITGLFMINSK